MTFRRWIVLAVLIAALVAIQAWGLDRQQEKLDEDLYTKLEGLPAGDALPTVTASLFFGSFRAIAVDVLWIQLKKVVEEKRWYERKQIVELISYFQPRNPEVWSHLGWDSAYNVANGFKDPEKSWYWVRFGLTWLRQGNRMLPESPYLKFELAGTLIDKTGPAWKEGFLDLAVLKRIEEDAELQELLGNSPPNSPRSAFELAIPWLEKARDELRANAKEQFVLTPGGLYLRADNVDGYLRRCFYLQAMYCRRRGNCDEAKAWLRRAAEHVRVMLEPGRYPNEVSSLHKDWARLYAELPAILDLERKALQDPTPENELALLVPLQKVIVGKDEEGLLDDGFFASTSNPEAPLNKVKRKLSGGIDGNECNDAFKMATTLREGEPAWANLAPQGLDVDFYILYPPGKAPAGRSPVTLRFDRPESSGAELKVTIFEIGEGRRTPIHEENVIGKKEIRFEAASDRILVFKVEPLHPASPWPADARYMMLCARD